jgi:transposase
MDLIELYTESLGITAPWKIVKVELDSKAFPTGEVVVTVEFDKDSKTDRDGHIHGYVDRTWRHLDTCQFQTLIVCRVPRIKFPDGRTEEMPVRWAERFSRVTTLMEAHCIDILQTSKNTTAASQTLKMSRGSLDRIMARAVARGLECRADSRIRYVGIDEKAMRRGHRYVTILSDIEGGRVIDLVEGRDTTSAISAWNKLTPKQRDQVDATAMDMWPAYMNAAKTMVPDADIVHDRFHVAGYLGKGVDTVRKQENRELVAVGDRQLVGTKYKWLKRHDDLRSSEASGIRSLYKKPLETAKAWGYKEWFDDFWTYRSSTWALKFFNQWYRSVIHTRLEPMKKVARTLKNHLEGLLTYAKHPITNAVSEGLNSKIQSIRSSARGLPNFEKFRVRVLFFCGKLSLHP